MIHKLWQTKQVAPQEYADPIAAVCSCGAFYLTASSVFPRVGAATSTLKRPRNSDGEDRVASPGWGGTAPSKSLTGLHGLGIETTDHIDTRSRIGHKQRAITAVTHGACQRLSPDSETRTGITHARGVKSSI